MKSLSEAAVRQYRELGYCAPVAALSSAEAATLRDRLEQFEACAGVLSGRLRHKPHLLFTWLNDLVRHPRILDAVEDIIGPDILCWGTSFFIKEKRDPGYVSWHQDSTYWGLEPAGHHYGLGRVHRQHRGEWGDAGDPGVAQAGPGAASRHLRR